MRRAIIPCGTASFIMAFLGGVLAFSLVAPSSATAQSSPPQEVRASAFTLVGSDGTVLATLAPSPGSGAGLLQLYDAAGTRHLGMVGAGAVQAFDEDGTTPVFRAGRTFTGLSTGPPLNGVELGPGGSISRIPPSP